MANKESSPKPGRSKALAILLAVLFGPWTWLYTYHRDKWKFWGSLIGVAVFFLIVAIIDQTLPSENLSGWGTSFFLLLSTIFIVFHNIFLGIIALFGTAFYSLIFVLDPIVPDTGNNLILACFIWATVWGWAGIWIWAIIDSARKPKAKYESEPPERNKKTALLTAILFGYNAWLYTYHKDKWKFWASFGAVTLIMPASVAVGWGCTAPLASIPDVSGTGIVAIYIGTAMFFNIIILGTIWVLALIDNLPRSKKWINFETLK